MGTSVFTVWFFKLLCTFESFHNKTMGKNWHSQASVTPTFLPLLNPTCTPGRGLGCRPTSLIVSWTSPSLIPDHSGWKPRRHCITDPSLFLRLIIYTLKYPHSPSSSLSSPTLTKTIPTLSPHDSQTANLIVFLPIQISAIPHSLQRYSPNSSARGPSWSAPGSTFTRSYSAALQYQTSPRSLCSVE